LYLILGSCLDKYYLGFKPEARRERTHFSKKFLEHLIAGSSYVNLRLLAVANV
jgi:hypothetical protein